MKKISTRQIGDNKLPNKYWVTISNDYYYESEPGHFDWVSGRDEFKVKGKTLQVFNTYKKALELFNSVDTGSLIDGIEVNSKCIEDRLSGQLLEETMQERKRITYEFERWEDTKFTERELAKRGKVFI